MKRIKIRRPDEDLENQLAERAQRSEATLASADGLRRHCARARRGFTPRSSTPRMSPC